MAALDPVAVARLVKILGYLGSTHDGERAAAAAAADRFLKMAGLTWEELLSGHDGAGTGTGATQRRTTPPQSNTDWRPSKLRGGCPGSWRRRNGTILSIRQCRPPSKSWYATFDGRMVYDPQGCNFFDSEEEARCAAELWEDRYDADSRR